MNFNHLHYFHVVAQEGTLARAAKRLNITQPTLSGQLKQLEEHFGHKLFDRASGALRLNANGRKAFEVTQEMFRLSSRLDDIFPGRDAEPRVRLEVGIATTVGRSFAVERFITLFKSQRILTRVRQGDHEYLFHELLATGLDLLITDSLPHRRKERGTDCRKLSSPEFVVAGGRKFVSSLKEPTIEGLHGQPFIHYTSHSAYRFEIDQYLRQKRVEPRVVAEADDVYVIRDAIAANIGAGVLPRGVIEESKNSRQFQVLATLERKFEIYALFSKRDPSEEVLTALEILAGAGGSGPC
ncbi:LysR family transcriptional regulator [Luteolibacter flavescens]|uniref:LysR family transcriptional regulator n=1 Tax=Luteolibacter flavescens TaxID=1859460 RepID=A0ABT3FJ16_9BACT|nr:LysR family transcriptional regulator [Luteolibacter flavescens]MCW1883561.1 LysR family transcriptional regulator [Luteolibacter flavescens]